MLYNNELDQDVLDRIDEAISDATDIDGICIKNFLHHLSAYGYTIVEIEPIHEVMKELGEMLSELGGCDHSVNICQCGVEYNLEKGLESLGMPMAGDIAWDDPRLQESE